MGISRTSIVLGSALLFTLGVLVGQDVGGPIFLSKYLRSGPMLRMELAMVQANLDIIRDRAGFSSGTLMPGVSYDASCRCFKGYAVVGSELMKKTLANSESRFSELLFRPIFHFSKATGLFSMTFAQISADPAKRTFAEFKDGELTFK